MGDEMKHLVDDRGRLAGSRPAEYEPGRDIRTTGSWSTVHEMLALDYMATVKERPSGLKYTGDDRRKKLKVWLLTSLQRRWDHGVNVGKCQEHANKLLRELGE